MASGIFVANPDYDDCDVGQGDACGGVTIAHLNFAGYGDLPRIVKVGEAEVSWETTRGGWIYIHDMTVQTWPGEDPEDPRYGRTYVYGAYWEAGLRIFDVTDVPHPNKDMADAYSLVEPVDFLGALKLDVIGALQKLANGWTSQIMMAMVSPTVGQLVTKMVVVHLTSIMLNPLMKWLMQVILGILRVRCTLPS